WPWLGGVLAAVVAAVAVLRLRPAWRRPGSVGLGAAAGLAAVAALAVFGAADSPTGRVAWLELSLGAALAAVLLGVLVRLRGVGPGYQRQAANPAGIRGVPVGGMRCRRQGAGPGSFEVHVELFAKRQVIVVPGRIGVSRSGCVYPLSTATPTGVLDVDRAG